MVENKKVMIKILTPKKKKKTSISPETKDNKITKGKITKEYKNKKQQSEVKFSPAPKI